MLDTLHKHRTALVILLGIAVLYLPVYQLGFALDDIFLIEKNPYLRSNPWALLTGDLWLGDESVGKSSFFRPIFLLSLLLDLSLGGAEWVFHVQNLLWHVLASAMFYVLSLRWLDPLKARWAMCIFACHPIQSEVVIWISARNDSMAAFFTFLALWLYTEKRVLMRGVLLRMGIVCCALLSKESAILIPVVIGLISIDRRLYRIVESGMAVLLIVCLRWYLDLGVNMSDQAHWDLFWNSLDVIVLGDASRLLAPWPLCATRAIAWDVLSILEISTGFIVLLSTLLLLRQRNAVLALLIGLLFWIPTLWPTLLNGMHGDRYLYLPLAGVAFAISSVLPWRRWMFLILVLWMGVIQLRIPEWKGDHSLWSSMYEQKPSSFSAVSFAHILFNEKKYQEAGALYQEGYAEAVPYLAGCGPYTVSLLKVLGPEVALEGGAWALERGCLLSGMMGGVLALGLTSEKRWEDALELIQISPPDPTKRMMVVKGVLALREGHWDEFLEVRSSWNDQVNFDRQINLLLRIDDLNIISFPILLK